MLRRTVVLLLVLALAPSARAESLAGQVRFGEGVHLEGDATVDAAQGALDLAEAVLRGRDLALRFSRAEGYVVTRGNDHVGVEGVLEPYRGGGTPRNETFSLPAGALENLTCQELCRVLLFAAGGGSAVLSLEGPVAGPLGVVVEEKVYASGAADRPTKDSFLYRVEPGWMAASTAPVPHAPSLVVEGAQARAAGDLVLFLAEAAADWHGEEGQGRLSAERTSRDGAAGLPVQRREEVRFLVLRMWDAELAAPPGVEALLLAPAPSLDLAGALRADHARGHLRVGGERVPLDGVRLEVEGRLGLRPLAEAPPVPALPAPTGLPLDATLDGEATRVVLDGHALALDPPPAVSPRTLAAGLSVAGVLAALLWLKLAGIPFYMRLTHASLLRNDNRRRVYEAIRDRPGVTTAEIVRATGLAEIVVRHHVRMLEVHRHVAVRPVGKLRAHFALDGRTGPEEALLHVALKDGTRRRIAGLLASSPSPLTQGGLAEAAGVSRRLVSHHLARLEEQGLVLATGATPRAYAPTERLRAFLSTAPLAEPR